MEKPYIPDKWKNLTLEINDTSKDYIKDDCNIYEPRIIRTESILNNKKDVFKENHKKYYEDCYNSKINYKCVIL